MSVHILGVDLGKNFCSVVGGDLAGEVILRRSMRRPNRSGAINGREAFNPLFMHPTDLEKLDAATGDFLRISLPYSSTKAIARADDSLRPGVVAMSHNFGGTSDDEGQARKIGSNVNQLIVGGAVFDPYTGMSKMSAIPVALERIVP